MPSEAGVHRPLSTVAEATEVLRIGRSLGYQLAREFLASGGTTGLPVIRLGRESPKQPFGCVSGCEPTSRPEQLVRDARARNDPVSPAIEQT